eukprot:5127477-Heterocapsa_arctica.AAC.1
MVGSSAVSLGAGSLSVATIAEHRTAATTVPDKSPRHPTMGREPSELGRGTRMERSARDLALSPAPHP